MKNKLPILFAILMTLTCVSTMAACSGDAPLDFTSVESTNANISVVESSAQEENVPTDTSEPSSSTQNTSEEEIPNSSSVGEIDPPFTQSNAQSGTSSSETAQSDSSAVTIDSPAEQDETMTILNIKIGGKNFTVTLYDNATAQTLVKKLPLTLDMKDLNGNEKYYYFSDHLPASSQQVGGIKTGDLMLYGSDCLVLFYENFSTSYSYTRLGHVEDTTGLAYALGRGSVEIAFSVGDQMKKF